MIEKNFRDVLKKAKEYHQNGDLISAINTYLKIIDIEFENISMLVAQKEENVAIIRKNGGVFSALITSIEEKLRK